MESIVITSVHTGLAYLSSFPAFRKARRRASFSSTLPHALSASHISFPISDSLSEEQLCWTTWWSRAICYVMVTFVSYLIMSHCTWDSHTGNALPAWRHFACNF